MFEWFLALLAMWLVGTAPAPVPTPSAVTLPAVYVAPVPTQTQTSHVDTQCPVLAQAGYEIWFPGQVAPHSLYADTAARRLVYVAPEGYVVLYRSSGGSSTSELRPLDSYCH